MRNLCCVDQCVRPI